MATIFFEAKKEPQVHTGEKMKVLLLGGLGVVGRILTPALSKEYDVLLSDIKDRPSRSGHDYVRINVANFHQLMDKVPRDLDVLVNLAAVAEQEAIVSDEALRSMTDVYITGSYNVLLAAARLHVGKVIFASSNHASGAYEENGHSLLKREITATDCPIPDSAYGAMKLCAEHFGRLFSAQFDMSVICLRLGTVVPNEHEFVVAHDRARRTILSSVDAADIFIRSIESNVRYGVYYAVSDNPGKPWSIQEAIDHLGYFPSVNSEKILKEGG
jgi:NAD+ dependent glucose-6-phosphate dehydrogenase